MTLSAAALRLLEDLASSGRVRVGLTAVRAAFHRAAPDAIAAPDQRARLAAALHELADAGRIRLPAHPRSWDQSAEPPLPRTVNLAIAPRSGSHPAAPPASSFPWHPELAFAAGLRLAPKQMELLRKVNAWLRDRDESPRVVPSRERSLEIFGAEKVLDTLSRTVLFGPDRLTFELLACEPLSPPFVWSATGVGDTLLVAENHHTFHSLGRALEGRATAVAFVAYGGGRAFTRSVTHAKELPRPIRRILYFGDLDPQGLRIPQEASAAALAACLPPVQPASHLYRLLLEHGRPAPAADPALSPPAVDALVTWLPPTLRPPVSDLLASGYRIPQEWLGLDLLLSLPLTEA